MITKGDRPLIWKSSRFIGSALIERMLITSDVLENANDKLLELVQAGDLKSANLLSILAFNLGALDEVALIRQTIESEKIGLIDLSNYSLIGASGLNLNLDICRALYTLPFDQFENFTLIATAYYLSKPARDYWEEQFKESNVVWYVAQLNTISEALETLATESTGENAPA